MNELLGRMQLEGAIAKAKARNARRTIQNMQDKAADARDSAADLIARHPFATLAGGVALGVLIGAMLPRRKAAGSMRNLARQAMDLGLAHGRDMLAASIQAGRKGQEATEELGERIADNAREIAEKAGRSSRDIKERLGL